MQTELVEKTSVSATVKVTVPPEDVDAAFEKVLRDLARQVRIPGFRPGRAPRGVVIKNVGEDAFRKEVRDALVDEAYPPAMREHELAPIHAHFHADPPAEGEPFTFEIHADLYPEFELADPDEIVIDSVAEPVTDARVAETVENLRRENATLVPVDRAAEPGDVLSVETVSDDAGEESEEGDEGDDEPAPGSTMPIDLENVGDHLARQLLGASIGEVVELELDEPAAELPEVDEDNGEEGGEEEGEDESAAPRTLKVKITDIKEKDKPEADDDFAATLGFDSWEEVERQIRASLERQVADRAFEEQRDEFVEKLMEGTDVELPSSLVNRRKMNLLENLTDDLEQRGSDLDAYLASLEEQGERENFDAELTEAAERGVKRDLVLERLLEQRGTELSDDEFNRALTQLAARQGSDPVRFRRERGEAWLDNYRYMLRRDKALRAAVRDALGEEPNDAAATAETNDDDEIVDAGSAPAPGSDAG